MSRLLWLCTACAAAYPWLLPLLASTGFAESGAESISGFIDNPQATGAMAVVSFAPLHIILRHHPCVMACDKKHALWLSVSQAVFLLAYGLFLAVPLSCSRSGHQIVVLVFEIAFIVHACHVWRCIHPVSIPAVVLGLGALSFLILVVVAVGTISIGLWFWAIECVGFSAMVLFTPLILFGP